MADACYTIYPSPAHDGKKVGFSFPMIFRFSSSSRSSFSSSSRSLFSSSSRSLFSFSSRSSFSSSSRMSHHCQFRWSSTRSDLPLNISVNRSLNIRQYIWPAHQCTVYCWTELVHSSAPGALVTGAPGALVAADMVLWGRRLRWCLARRTVCTLSTAPCTFFLTEELHTAF